MSYKVVELWFDREEIQGDFDAIGTEAARLGIQVKDYQYKPTTVAIHLFGSETHVDEYAAVLRTRYQKVQP